MKRRRSRTLLARVLTSRSRQTRLAWAGLVLLLVVALRLPWLEADGGNVGFASYGVFTTDEGYNTSGGRLLYLTGQPLDTELLDPVNHAWGWGMSLLNGLGYQVGGLTFGAARLPTLAAAMLGWLVAYWLASRATLPAVAGGLTLLLCCNPLSLTYERIHNSDVVIGALIILAYGRVRTRRLRGTLVAGLVMGLTLSVKMTAIGLLPLVVLGVVTREPDRLKRLGGFILTLALTFGLLVWWREHCVAVAGGRGDPLVVATLFPASAAVTFSLSEWLRALSIYPRWPLSCQMGPFAIWFLMLPGWYVLQAWHRTRRLLTARAAVFVGIALYLSMWAIQPQSPLRRSLPPVLYFLPLLLIYARSALPRRDWARWLPIGLGLVTVGLLGLYWLPKDMLPAELQGYRYHEYIVPAKVSWRLTWLLWLVGLPAVLAVIHAAVRGATDWRSWSVWTSAAVAALWIFSSNYILPLLGIRGSFIADQLALQLAAMTFLLVLLVGGWWRVWWRWYGLCLLLFVGFALADSNWREAYADQIQRHYVERDAAAKLAGLLPRNSIVLGRRSTQLLRGTALRLGMVLPIWEPPKYFADVERLLQRYPERPLYLLLDSDGTAPGVVTFLRDHPERFQTALVATLQQYADGTPQLVPLYVLGIRASPPDTRGPAAR